MSRLVRSIVALGVVAGLVACGAVASHAWAAPLAADGNSVGFPDSTDDNGGGPDVSRVTIANDDHGTLTFTVELPNRPTLGASGLLIALNTDDNPATGDPKWDGVEYMLSLDGNYGGSLGFWNGSQWDFGVPHASLVYSYAAGVATFRINISDLGNTKSFRFYAAAADFAAADPSYDWAPDQGIYSYAVTIASPAAKAPAHKAPKPRKPAKKPHKKR